MTFFECYADESLLKYLGFNSKELKGGHSFGRSNVGRKLNKTSNSVGLVDEDPNASQDPYLKYLFSLKPVYHDKHLICSKDQKKNNILIAIRPNLEVWAVKLAYEMKIDLSNKKYGLSMQTKELHDLLTHKDNILQRKRFLEFISDISEHESIINLKKLVKI